MATVSPDKVIYDYAKAYQKLYKRSPKELRMLDQNWVIVNGARMRISDLSSLTVQLNEEYMQSMGKQRGLVMRLIKWLKS